MAVIDNTEGGLQESTDLIAHCSSYAGLKINDKKTQCMVISGWATIDPPTIDPPTIDPPIIKLL